MGYKQQVKKAKKYVREQLESVQPVDLPLEQQIELAEDKFKELIQREENELERIEVEVPQIGRYAALQHKLIHLYLSGNYSQKQIARILCVGEQTVGRWLREPQIREAIDKYQEEENLIVNSSLRALRMKAIEKANELMESENEMVASIMVRDVLDRTGHKAVEKKQVDINMTYEQRIQMLMQEEELKENVENVDYTIHGDEPKGKINTEGEDISD